uniref:Lipoprotein n=1 Tax=Geobacter metallireducens TaxID=28232 RepID=A0A831U4D7_GEOME
MIRKTAASLVCLALLAGTAHAGNVDFSIGINLGTRPTVVSYEPVYAPAPPPVRHEPVYVPAPPPVVIAEPPAFVLSPSLGFYVAMDIPYDLFYVGNRYYLSRNGGWYQGASYRGPWTTVEYRFLPRELRRYPVATIRRHRDRDYRHWCDDDHGRWRSFRPEREWRTVRKEEKSRWKEAKWREKEWRRHDRDRWDDRERD